MLDITDIYRTFHSNTKRHMIYFELHVAISMDHILGHKIYKIGLKIYKIIEMTPYILLNHHGLTLDINNNRNKRKLTNS